MSGGENTDAPGRNRPCKALILLVFRSHNYS